MSGSGSDSCCSCSLAEGLEADDHGSDGIVLRRGAVVRARSAVTSEPGPVAAAPD